MLVKQQNNDKRFNVFREKRSPDFSKESLSKGKNFYTCVRRVVTTKTSGPELFKDIYLFGKETTLKHLKHFLDTAEVKKAKITNVSKAAK